MDLMNLKHSKRLIIWGRNSNQAIPFCIIFYYFVLLLCYECIIWWYLMSEKMTVLNIRISLDEKNEIKDRAEKEGLSVSSYARNLLFSEDNTEDTQDNTVVIQEKDERISDLKNQIDDYKKQIEQLHTIILATQKDNQLLIELKTKKWWQFWK